VPDPGSRGPGLPDAGAPPATGDRAHRSTHPGLAEELLVRTGWLVLLTDLVVLTARLLS
jgi:hypothetical protein